LNGAFCISTKNFIIKEEISKLEQKQEKQEKDKNEITALKDKDLFDTSFSYKFNQLSDLNSESIQKIPFSFKVVVNASIFFCNWNRSSRLV
jgi:hypothetical protein